MTPISSRWLLLLPLAVFALASNAAELSPEGVVNLAASANAEVPKDMIRLGFTATHDGRDANEVQDKLKQALDTALAEARRAAVPGMVDVQTGNFSLHPRYDKTVITGWQGSAELVVEGRDMAAIGQLAGRITTMTVGRVVYSLSREQREKVEADVATRAITRFREKAADYARQFGYGSYTVREVHVSTAEAAPPMPRAMPMAAKAASAYSDALPIEAGRADVSVTVSGTVQMRR